MQQGGIIAIVKSTYRGFQTDDLQGAAAEVAYHFLFAVAPLLIFVTALAGFVSHAVGVQNAMDNITRWLFDHIGSADAARTIQQSIQPVIENQSSGLLSAGALLALWGGKGAMGALMKGLNAAYDAHESRSWWAQTAISIGLTIALGLAVIAASVFFLEGAVLGDKLASAVDLSHTWSTVWNIFRWPLIVVMLDLALGVLYWAGPNVSVPFRWVTVGSVLAIALWGVATYGLKFYFTHFASYVTAYGALGGVLAFIFWVYVMSLILLLGGEVNSVLERRAATRRDATGGPEPRAAASRATSSRRPRSGNGAVSAMDAASEDFCPWPPEPRRAFRRAVTGLAVTALAAATAAIVRIGRRGSR